MNTNILCYSLFGKAGYQEVDCTFAKSHELLVNWNSIILPSHKVGSDETIC